MKRPQYFLSFLCASLLTAEIGRAQVPSHSESNGPDSSRYRKRPVEPNPEVAGSSKLENENCFEIELTESGRILWAKVFQNFNHFSWFTF